MSNFVNTKKSVLFLSKTVTLPTPPAGFLELNDEFVVNPNPTVEEFNRVSSLLGGTDSYADVCHTVLDQEITHTMRTNDKSGSALDTSPQCAELFSICGLEEAKTADTVKYVNSQNPAIGSAVFNIDGKQYTAKGSVAGEGSWEFEIGKPSLFKAKMSAFLDNDGIPTDTTITQPPLSDEDVLMMACTDILLADGQALQADKMEISMNPEVGEKYALGLKEFAINDYVIKLTASFFVGSDNYADAITKLGSQDVETISIKLNTTTGGALQDGKSLLITADKAKYSTFSDDIKESSVFRSVTWLLRPNATGENITFQYGKFA